jgi:hypothetical protein
VNFAGKGSKERASLGRIKISMFFNVLRLRPVELRSGQNGAFSAARQVLPFALQKGGA